METIEQLKQQLENERKARLIAEKHLEDLRLHTKDNNGLFELIPFPALMITPDDFRIERANHQAIKAFEHEGGPIEGRLYTELAPPSVKSAGSHPVNGERMIQIREREHYYFARSSVYATEEKQLLLVVLYDLTHYRNLFSQFSAREREYRELVETVSDIIYRANRTGHFTYVNPTAVHTTGYDENELIGCHFTKLVREDFRSKLVSFYTFQMKEGIRSTYTEFPIITRNNEEIWVGQTVDIHPMDNGETEFIALCRDISDRKKVEKALMLSEEKYRSIIENLELGLLEVDKNGRIVKAYPQFCNLTGYSPEDLEGKVATEVLVKKESMSTVEEQNRKRQKGIPSVYELEILKKDGTPIWVIISGAPYYNERNEMIGTVGIHLDITSRKNMEKELIDARDIAENSLRSKDQFLANMSHEIRTPMNAIIGMSRLLADSGLTTKQQHYVSAIRTSSENLLNIVNDLLDFSKLEAGKIELDPVPRELGKVLRSALDLWHLRIDEKGLLFEQSIDPSITGYYLFDPVRLTGIITNLLHNAIKFTEHGSIRFEARITSVSDTSDLIFFSVSDTGIGIPPEKQQDIFESFAQAESSTTRKYGGTGLGLSISRELVRLMGGELELSSESEKGARFYFTLELQRTEDVETESQETPDHTTIQGLRVLLVEDNEINRFMAQTILEQWKCAVVCVENGVYALEQLENNAFDLILMDMQMPELDGIETTRIIRGSISGTIPIIALTANAVKGEQEKCMEAGMNSFISKPFKQEDLLRIILATIDKTKRSP